MRTPPPGLLIRPSLAAFAKELRAARRHAEMSQEELAKRAKMTRQGLAKIERSGNATLGSIILLADALDCQVADFFPRKSPWQDQSV
jgi:transcriptional regulator with XRE-family HTH domain